MLKSRLPLDLPRSVASDLLLVCCLLGDPVAGGHEWLALGKQSDGLQGQRRTLGTTGQQPYGNQNHSNGKHNIVMDVYVNNLFEVFSDYFFGTAD